MSNQKRYWLRGGIIFVLIPLLYIVLISVSGKVINKSFSDGQMLRTPRPLVTTLNILNLPQFVGWIITTETFRDFEKDVTGSDRLLTYNDPSTELFGTKLTVLGGIIAFIIWALIFFIPGVIVGWTYGKIKNRKRNVAS